MFLLPYFNSKRNLHFSLAAAIFFGVGGGGGRMTVTAPFSTRLQDVSINVVFVSESFCKLCLCMEFWLVLIMIMLLLPTWWHFWLIRWTNDLVCLVESVSHTHLNPHLSLDRCAYLFSNIVRLSLSCESPWPLAAMPYRSSYYSPL